MKPRFLFLLVCFVLFQLHAALPSEYPSLKADAEKLFNEGSFAKANEVYQEIALTNLPSAEQRWVEFRRADTQWRSAASTENADTTKLDEARSELEKQIRDLTRDDQHDRVWAEVEESLGDFFWTRRNHQSWSEAWPHYQAALDWWAGQSDLDLARARYFAIVWRMAKPPEVQPYYSFGAWGNYVPLDVLENALKIAQTENDKGHAHYLIAMTIRNRGGGGDQLARVPEEFEGAIKAGKTTDWYDDALYNYAEWMTGQGRVIPLENGSWRSEPDYPKALELFRRLVSEFKKGETRYWEQAQQQIRNITDPQLGVSVANVFLPDSEIQYQLNWRNVKHIEIALYAVELNRDVNFPAEDENRKEWLQTIDLGGREKIKSWSYNPHPQPLSHPMGKGGLSPGEGSADNYKPGNDTLHLDEKLKPGAYILEAQGGGKSARDIVLVTDAAMVLKASGKQALVYFCNALDSSPILNAKIKLWESWWDDDRKWHWREYEKTADTNGIAVFQLEQHTNRNAELFASAISTNRQAFSSGNSYQQNSESESWRIYAFTDRPAYRPKETAHWKFIARRYDGSVYSTPSNQKIKFEITDPRGAKIKSETITLNSFGSAWGDLELTEKMPLGEYSITFWDETHKYAIGNATLFRLEEYKLPEFKVTVQTPEENGKKKTFRLDDEVEATIQADYYFGGAVSDAKVEVIVRQKPFWHVWHEPRKFPWLYADMNDGNSPFGRYGNWYGGGQTITNAILKTDATGKAVLKFDTPKNSSQDLEFDIEARVTDASRREITGNGSVRVTRQRYYVDAKPEHNLYRPQDKVTVNFKALDANDQPVQTDGTVKITRDYWFEIWLAPDGHEVKGNELRLLKSANKIWPPAPARRDQRDWELKFRGYQHDDILTRSLKTDTNGEAELSFTPEREGYYRVAWTSGDSASGIVPEEQKTNSGGETPPAHLIQAETTVWIANNSTTELGYRSGGVEIIADEDTFRVGQSAPVMLVANTADRYVLFSVEGEDLYNYQLVHMNGTVKLIDLPVEEKHVPNIFLNATLVSDRQIFTDTKQIVVPPVKNFLTVNVKPDRETYEPRDEGTLTISTKDDAGKPVSAEVALGLVDESVYYIQNDYAGDPRQFFFGTKRAEQVQTQSTMNRKSYAKLVPWQEDKLIDERDKNRVEENDRQKNGVFVTDSATFGRGIGGFGGAVNDELKENLTWATGAINRLPAMSEKAPQAATRRMAVLGDMPMTGALLKSKPASPSPGEEPAVIVRSDFRSTVFWQPNILTDSNGEATVKFKYPDSTTSWKATARAVSEQNQFGIAETNTQTRQPLIVRLQAPRFFVVGDLVAVSAVLNNNSDEPMQVAPELDADGLVISGIFQNGKVEKGKRAPSLTVPAHGEARQDWAVSVQKPGPVKLKAIGRAEKYSDAMEKIFTAYEHGIEKYISKSGKARGGDVTVKLDLPRERKTNSTSLVVQITPSLAVTMLDALPYLINYPYGCTEQTMSRFLPAAITAKTLRDLGLKPEDVMGRVFGGIEKRAVGVLPAGSSGKMPGARQSHLDELGEIEKSSLDRLYDFQHSDGGWGWWKEGESDHWMTAYVVWGMSLARDAGVEIKEDVLRRAVKYLDEHLVEEEQNFDMQAFMLHALAAYRNSKKETKLTEFEDKAFTNLLNNRAQLNAYTRALLALSAHDFGKTNEAKVLIENLENGVVRDERPDTSVLIQPGTQNPKPGTILGTAHWGNDGIYWHWSDGGVEATAFALRAILAIDPTNQLVEPVCNWLIKNRRGAQWNSTRETAIVVLTLNDYLRASGELKGGIEYELLVNGRSIAKKKISAADVFSAPSRFVMDPKLIRDSNEIRIVRKSGDAPIYFAAEAKFFSTEEPIAPAGNEIFVKRDYYKLVSRPTLLKGYVYDREPLRDGGSVKSGERIETVLTIEAKNNYEYLMFEDLKPAGFEAAEIRSGESLYAKELKSGAVAKLETQNSKPEAEDFTGRARWVYQELRDRKVALFLDKLPQGVWQIRYEMRAETPGEFHALPVVGKAMYVPEIRCNGAEIRVHVEDAAR